MDAQHVICAGQVRHATRQADATCLKSAEFRHMAGATQACSAFIEVHSAYQHMLHSRLSMKS